MKGRTCTIDWNAVVWLIVIAFFLSARRHWSPLPTTSQDENQTKNSGILMVIMNRELTQHLPIIVMVGRASLRESSAPASGFLDAIDRRDGGPVFCGSRKKKSTPWPDRGRRKWFCQSGKLCSESKVELLGHQLVPEFCLAESLSCGSAQSNDLACPWLQEYL